MGQAAGLAHMDYDTLGKPEEGLCDSIVNSRRFPSERAARWGHGGPLQAKGRRLGFISKLLESAFQKKIVFN